MDAVITWVDSTNTSVNIQQTYDAERVGERRSLKYTLRSIYYNLSWIDNIYIVTNNQWPSWLDEKHSLDLKPRIVRIDHTDINPEKKPMYGCPAIEVCLDRIPNLSEVFLYANDDTFVINKMLPNEWTDGSKTIFRYSLNPNINFSKCFTGYNYYDIYYQYLLAKNIYPMLIDFVKPLHHIVALSKSSFEIAKNEFPDLYKKTYTMIGRPETERISRCLMEFISVGRGDCILHDVTSSHITKYLDRANFAPKYIHKDTKLLCINHIWDLPQNIEYFLKSVFPKKIPSEKY